MNRLFLYYHPRYYMLIIASTFEEAYSLIDSKYKTTNEGYLIPFQTAVDLIQDLGVNIIDAKRVVKVLTTTKSNNNENNR